MAVTVEWLGHASFRITEDKSVIYIDPWKISEAAHDARLILVSHSHYDHYNVEDIDKILNPRTELVGPPDVISQRGAGYTLSPGQTMELEPACVTGVRAYNTGKNFHPIGNGWLGFVIELAGKRLYYAGDTDLIAPMSKLGDIDLALLPVGGTFTMDATEAAEACEQIQPARAVPYHWGDIVGSLADAKRFAKLASCDVTVLKPGESLTL